MTSSPISGYGYPTLYGGPTPRIRTSVGGLGLAVSILLGLDAAMALLAAGFLGHRHALLSQFLNDPDSVGPNRLRDSDRAVAASAGWFIIFMVATIVVFLCWFWAARANAEAYGQSHGTLSPGWAIGGWFIPVASFVLPCIVARDIYRGTMGGRKGKPYSGGIITGWWWGLYVAFWLSGLVLTGANGKARNAIGLEDYLRDLRSAAAAGILMMVLGVAAAVLAIAYVQTITKAQKARNREGAWAGGPGMPVTGYGYGYAPPMPGYPMPGQAWVQSPMPANPAPGQPPVPPAQDQVPVTDPHVAETQTAETQTAEVLEIKPPEEPGDRLAPPS